MSRTRTIVAATAATALGTLGFVALPVTADAHGRPTCHGVKATIVGQGLVRGTSHRDVIVLTGPSVVYAGAGNDLICGSSGRDIINGGAGNDTIYGNGGNDVENGDAGNDVLSGGAGNDVLNGGTGNDVLNGDAGNDVENGGAGNDVVNGEDSGYNGASYLEYKVRYVVDAFRYYDGQSLAGN